MEPFVQRLGDVNGQTLQRVNIVSKRGKVSKRVKHKPGGGVKIGLSIYPKGRGVNMIRGNPGILSSLLCIVCLSLVHNNTIELQIDRYSKMKKRLLCMYCLVNQLLKNSKLILKSYNSTRPLGLY